MTLPAGSEGRRKFCYAPTEIPLWGGEVTILDFEYIKIAPAVSESCRGVLELRINNLIQKP